MPQPQHSFPCGSVRIPDSTAQTDADAHTPNTVLSWAQTPAVNTILGQESQTHAQTLINPAFKILYVSLPRNTSKYGLKVVTLSFLIMLEKMETALKLMLVRYQFLTEFVTKFK